MSKRTSSTCALLIGIVCGIIIGVFCPLGQLGESGSTVVVRDTTTVTDTLHYLMPTATDSVRTRTITRYLPVVKRDTIIAERLTYKTGDAFPPFLLSDERDSTAVEIPITQKRYEGEDYRAYVSGYEARLDSIFVYARSTTIRERSMKPPDKWHIGITGGYGITTNGLRPYIGIGLTYSIISF